MSSYYLLENQSQSHRIKFLIAVASIGWSITCKVLLEASHIVMVINVIVSITTVCLYFWARARRSDEDEATFREELRLANEGPSQQATAADSTFTSFSEEFEGAVADKMIPPPPSSAGEALKDKAQEKVVEVAAESIAQLFKSPGG